MADQKRKDDDEDDKNAVHRLTDIRTKEVSIVDRGANKRRFLVVKREGEGSEMSNKPNQQTEPAKGQPNAPVAKKGPTPENPMGEVDVPPPLDNPDRRGMDVDTTGAPITAYPEVQPPPPEAPKFTDEMPSAAGFAKSFSAIAKSMSELAGSKVEDASVLKAKFADVAKNFEAAANGVAQAFDEVHKRGAKMAAARLETMEKAVDALSKLVKDLKGIAENAGQTGERKEPQGVPPKEGVSDRAKTQKADTDPAPKFEMPDDLKVTLENLNASLTKVSEGLAGVTRVVKNQQTTITKMAGDLPPSNAGEVGERGGSPAVQDVEWPLDMNNVPDRKEVTKRGTSFFGEQERS